MKKNLLIAIAMGALTASSFGQGVLIFQAGAGHLQYTTDGSTLISAPTGTPDAVNYSVSAYSATSGTTLNKLALSTAEGLVPDFTTAGWYGASNVLQTITPTAGAMPGLDITLNALAGAAGTAQQVELVAWTGNFASFTAALAGGGAVGWEGGTLSGGTFTFSITTGTATSPAAISGVVGAFSKLVVAPVPEPATMLLGGLGAAALVLFRRRK